MGVICEDLGALTTARARVLNPFERLSQVDSLEGCDRQRVRLTVIAFRMDNGGGNGAGCLSNRDVDGYSEVHECDSSKI